MSEQLTIFDIATPYGPNFQRRLGFWYDHQINPATVMKDGISLEMLDDGVKVRVRYKAVILPEGQSQWEPMIPAGITCDHGDQPHRAVIERHLDVPASEVLLSPHEVGSVPTMEVRRVLREGAPRFVAGGPVSSEDVAKRVRDEIDWLRQA